MQEAAAGMTNPEVTYETANAVAYEQRGATALITLDRARYNNAQNNQMTYALDDAFTRAAHDDSVAAIILCGAGKHFSAGHDIGTPGRDYHQPIDNRRSMWWNAVDKAGVERQYVREQEVYLGMCRRWRDIPKPTIAAVQGACIAGGLMLAWVCDLIVASDDAYFMDPVLQMGVGGVEYFAHPFEMPTRIAREFLMLGEKMPAERAYQVGMVNRIVPRDQLMAEAFRIADKIASKPRFAMTLAKQSLNFVDDVRGKRTAMEGVFAMHHLAHAHNSMTTEDGVAGQDIRSMKERNKE